MTKYSVRSLFLVMAGTVLVVSSCGTKRTAYAEYPPADICTEFSATTEASTDEVLSSASDDLTVPLVTYPSKTDASKRFGSVYSEKSAALIEIASGKIIAYRNEDMKIYPASLTKIMTLIVAVENIKDFSDTVLITDDMVIPMVERDASRAGFLPGETPSLLDLLYGMMLPSGADASLAIADYVAGSEEAFVELMNEKACQLGLKNTHFVNTTGLHEKEHYSTVSDIAVILEFAIRDDMCRRVMSGETYKCKPTEQHPEGLEFSSTLFSRMSGDEMPGITVKGGKTGFTDNAGNCIATYAQTDDDKTYILVFCGGKSNWDEIYNTLSAYSVFCVGGEPYRSARNNIQNKEKNSESTSENK